MVKLMSLPAWRMWSRFPRANSTISPLRRTGTVVAWWLQRFRANAMCPRACPMCLPSPGRPVPQRGPEKRRHGRRPGAMIPRAKPTSANSTSPTSSSSPLRRLSQCCGHFLAPTALSRGGLTRSAARLQHVLHRQRAVLKTIISKPGPMSATRICSASTAPTLKSCRPSISPISIDAPLRNWLAANPTKRPGYVVLFLDVPGRARHRSHGLTRSPAERQLPDRHRDSWLATLCHPHKYGRRQRLPRLQPDT